MNSQSPVSIVLERCGVDAAGTRVLHDISWRLGPGEHWGIVGGNGSGKTTLLGLIAGTRWPAPGTGTRVYDFGEGPERDAIEARRSITLVGHELQDRYTRWHWNFKAVNVVLSGLFRTDVPRLAPSPVDVNRALALLDDVGLRALAQRDFLTLSRGEQRRVLIARALAFAPRVLLLDEPASGLDAAARVRLDELLALAARRTRIVMTAHAVVDLPAIVTHALVLEAGRVVDQGPADDVRRRHRGGRPRIAAAVQTAVPAAASRHEVREDNPHTTLIAVHNADVWLGDARILRGIEWRLEEGEHWLVRGGNGAGKSTFLRLLHGQLRPARGGRVDYPALGTPRNIWALRRQIAWMSPELQAAYRYRTTVAACIGSGFDSSLGLVRRLTAVERDRIAQLLERFELTRFEHRLLTELSYGQCRRALLARAVVRRPRVLLLDEPWEGLDRAAAALLATHLDECAAEGTHVVTASHLAVDELRATHELVLDAGETVYCGACPRVQAG